MLEITPDDIALLSDTELRTLIGLLCEAELRNRGLSAAAVTWSGHQNSADGGLDVRVALADGETIEGFVPRPQTGFQVKKSPMPRAEILERRNPLFDGVTTGVVSGDDFYFMANIQDEKKSGFNPIRILKIHL